MKQQPVVKVEGPSRSKKKRQKRKQREVIRGLKEQLREDHASPLMKNGLQAFLQGGEYDVDIENIIVNGQRKALKKKLKRLHKNGVSDKHQIFAKLQQAKQKMKKVHNRTIFSNVQELKERRKKRAAREELNRKRTKREILH